MRYHPHPQTVDCVPCLCCLCCSASRSSSGASLLISQVGHPACCRTGSCLACASLSCLHLSQSAYRRSFSPSDVAVDSCVRLPRLPCQILSGRLFCNWSAARVVSWFQYFLRRSHVYFTTLQVAAQVQCSRAGFCSSTTRGSSS